MCGNLECTTPITENRPGCPAINLDLRCFVYNQQCNSDRDCDDGSLCCYQPNCGTTCNQQDKPGTWPVVKPRQAGTCVQECNLDIDCPGNEKCCSNGCGHVCRDPVVSNTGPCRPFPCPPPPTGACTKPKYVIMNGVKCPACYDIVPCYPAPKTCPVDPKPRSYCAKFNYQCKDDNSCLRGEKCCKRGCCYKCVKAV